MASWGGLIILLWGKNSKKTSGVAVKNVTDSVGKLHTDVKVPTIQERQHQWQQDMLQRWERIVSGGLSYKAGDSSRSSGGLEDDMALVWKVDDPTPPSMTALIHTHTLIDLFFYKVPLYSSPSVILKPATKTSGLISSPPHQARKDLDPTQGRWDNILLAWPPPILSPLSLSLSLPRGLDERKLNRLTDHRYTYTPNSPPSACVSVSVCDELWLARPMVSPQSRAAMLGQLFAAVGTGQTDKQTERQVCHPQAVIILWLTRAQIMATVRVSRRVNYFWVRCLTGAHSDCGSVCKWARVGVRCFNAPIRVEQ